jgi:outer membrane protein
MRILIILTTISLFIVTTSTAMADNLDGRMGVTVRFGGAQPLNNDFIKETTETKAGITVGGGLIYGFTEHLAVDLEVFQMLNLDVNKNGAKSGEVDMTDISLGLHYRFTPDNRFVPFLGAGVDIIKGDLKSVTDEKYTLDWTVGGHVNAGFDYFVTRGIALTADVRGIVATTGEITKGDAKVGDYNPMTFIGTVGFRFFIPEDAFN